MVLTAKKQPLKTEYLSLTLLIKLISLANGNLKNENYLQQNERSVITFKTTGNPHLLNFKKTNNARF